MSVFLIHSIMKICKLLQNICKTFGGISTQQTHRACTYALWYCTLFSTSVHQILISTQSHRISIQEELSLSQESNISTVSEDFPEESIVVSNDDEPNELINDNNIHENLLNFIRQNQELHRQVLLYEPLWLEV